MMIIWVNDKEMENYLPLIPERMHRSVLSGDWFCLGALADPVGTDDDGTDSKKVFEVSAEHSSGVMLPTVRVSADDMSNMKWLLENREIRVLVPVIDRPGIRFMSERDNGNKKQVHDSPHVT